MLSTSLFSLFSLSLSLMHQNQSSSELSFSLTPLSFSFQTFIPFFLFFFFLFTSSVTPKHTAQHFLYVYLTEIRSNKINTFKYFKKFLVGVYVFVYTWPKYSILCIYQKRIFKISIFLAFNNFFISFKFYNLSKLRVYFENISSEI